MDAPDRQQRIKMLLQLFAIRKYAIRNKISRSNGKSIMEAATAEWCECGAANIWNDFYENGEIG